MLLWEIRELHPQNTGLLGIPLARPWARLGLPPRYWAVPSTSLTPLRSHVISTDDVLSKFVFFFQTSVVSIVDEKTLKVAVRMDSLKAVRLNHLAQR